MSSKLTVGETIKEIERLQLKQAVLDQAIAHLDQFIVTDSFEPPNGIASPISADVVPQDVIVEVREELFVQKVAYETNIMELKGQPISGNGRQKKAAVTKKAPIKKKVVKRLPPKRRNINAKKSK